jgi:predicted phage tail protein
LSYVVEAGTTSGATNVVAFDTLSLATTFLAPGVPNGTYFVRIRARNAAGTSAPSNEITITGGSGGCAPGPPGALSVSVNGPSVAFQWGAASGGPTSYILEAGTTSGSSNVAVLDTGLVTQFTTAAPPGVYYVRVRARNGCGSSTPSNEVTVSVGSGCTIPGAPATFTVSLAGRVLTLAWSAATGQPTSYVVEAGSVSGASNIANADVGNRLSFTSNAPPGVYFIRVRARNSCGIGPASIERSVSVP